MRGVLIRIIISTLRVLLFVFSRIGIVVAFDGPHIPLGVRGRGGKKVDEICFFYFAILG